MRNAECGMRNQIFQGTSNNSQLVNPAPYPVRGKLRRESSNVKNLWIPAFAGMTFLSEADLKSAIPIPKPEVGGTG